MDLAEQNALTPPDYYDGGRTSTAMLVLDGDSMDRMMKLAEFMATGRCTLPAEFKNSPGDCLAIVMQAVQWRMNPYAVAQKTHFVSGKIGYEAQLVNSVITSMAPTKDRLHFEWFGDWSKVIGKFDIRKGDKGEYRVPGWQLKDEEGLGVKVWATLKGETEPRTLELLLAQARTRNSTLWADDPRQQLAYLATKRWARLYCPDVILGVYTPDEFDDAPPRERDMGNADVVGTRPAGPALPTYTVEALESDKLKMLKALASGKSHDTLLAMIRTKFVVPDDMEAKVRSLVPLHQAEALAASDELAEIKQLAEQNAINESDIRKQFGVGYDDMPARLVPDVVKFITEGV